MACYYLACDLGADSGRLILGALDNHRLTLEEVHRFPNGPLPGEGPLCWDIPRLFNELKAGLKKAAQRQLPIASISCDTWGVDYLLYDDQGQIIPPVFHYRDSRCQKGADLVRAKVPWNTIFEETGIQFMIFNTLFQLGVESRERLNAAKRILCIGDGFNYFLSGVAKTEVSLASTTQIYNPRAKAWSKVLLEALGLRSDQFPPIVPSGTRLGQLRPELCQETGMAPIEVIASCSHDTGAAVAAVPASGDHWAYLSSGTWSLIGLELPAPIITSESREYNFTNEIGYGDTVRFLKNIIGLWLVQESRREWERAGQKFDFATLERLAQEAPAFVSLINPADARFLSPGEMPQKIAALCAETGQPVPATPGATVRCIYESLALYYRHTLRNMEKITGRQVERLHIVGGGSKDAVLNQFSANACQIPVVAGPAEATATGNILVQAIALGHLPSLEAGRQVVAESLGSKVIQPHDKEKWDAAYERFRKLLV